MFASSTSAGSGTSASPLLEKVSQSPAGPKLRNVEVLLGQLQKIKIGEAWLRVYVAYDRRNNGNGENHNGGGAKGQKNGKGDRVDVVNGDKENLTANNNGNNREVGRTIELEEKDINREVLVRSVFMVVLDIERMTSNVLNDNDHGLRKWIHKLRRGDDYGWVAGRVTWINILGVSISGWRGVDEKSDEGESSDDDEQGEFKEEGGGCHEESGGRNGEEDEQSRLSRETKVGETFEDDSENYKGEAVVFSKVVCEEGNEKNNAMYEGDNNKNGVPDVSRSPRFNECEKGSSSGMDDGNKSGTSASPLLEKVSQSPAGPKLRNVEVLLGQLQKIKIGEAWLRVYVAYDRRNNGNGENHNGGGAKGCNVNNEKKFNEAYKDGWYSNDGNRYSNGSRRYVDVVNGDKENLTANNKGNNRDVGRTIELEEKDINREVLVRSVVGEVKAMCFLSKLSVLCKEQGFEKEEVKLLGGLEFMVVLDSERTTSNVLNDNDHGLRRWIHKLRRGDDYGWVAGRVTWINILGVSISGWKGVDEESDEGESSDDDEQGEFKEEGGGCHEESGGRNGGEDEQSRLSRETKVGETFEDDSENYKGEAVVFSKVVCEEGNEKNNAMYEGDNNKNGVPGVSRSPRFNECEKGSSSGMDDGNKGAGSGSIGINFVKGLGFDNGLSVDFVNEVGPDKNGYNSGTVGQKNNKGVSYRSGVNKDVIGNNSGTLADTEGDFMEKDLINARGLDNSKVRRGKREVSPSRSVGSGGKIMTKKRKDNEESFFEGGKNELNFNTGLPNDENKELKKKIGKRSVNKVNEVDRKTFGKCNEVSDGDRCNVNMEQVKEIEELIGISWRLVEEEKQKKCEHAGNKAVDIIDLYDQQ
ncbi:hypothetical protein Tco_1195622 [Tanacetum coccineum]